MLDIFSGGETMRRHNLHLVVILIVALTTLVTIGNPALALKKGEVRETEFSTGLSEATGVVRIIVAILGGLISLLGIVVAYKGIAGKADVSISLSEQRKITFKRVSQGVVITIVGACILVAAVYFLPEKRSERVIKGEDITIEREAGRERVKAK
jgi:hypothetical protein